MHRFFLLTNPISTALLWRQLLVLALLVASMLPGLQARAQAAPLPNTLGQQNTLVVLVNFLDQPANQPWTSAAVSTAVFGQASDFFRENSYGQSWLAGTVTGWHTLALSSTACDTYAIQQQGKAAASAAGFNLANYQRFVFIFPSNSACGFSGLGDIGQSPSNTWINGSIDYKLIAHEIGHNFGLTHAGSLDCGTDVLSGTCTPSLKSHMLDIMGSLTAGHFSAHAKERLGWLNSNNLQTVESSGSYSLGNYETNDGGIKALKVRRGTDTSGNSTWYYLEARKAQGHDSFLATYGNASQGIAFTTTHPAYANQGFQLDTTPNSSDWGDFADAALTTGNTFSDAISGVSFTTDYVNSAGAGVTILMPASTSTPTAPATGSNSAPVAVNDAVKLASKVASKVNVLANDSDPEGSKLSIIAVVASSRGTVSINSDGTLTYTPGKTFKNSDSFSYTISDGDKSATATVSISLQTTSTRGK